MVRCSSHLNLKRLFTLGTITNWVSTADITQAMRGSSACGDGLRSMLRTKIWMFCLTLGATFWLSAPTFAASPGEIGAVSKASISIRVTVAQKLTLSQARLIMATDHRTPGSEARLIEFCVDGRTATGNYRITVYGVTSKPLSSAGGFAGPPGSCPIESFVRLSSATPLSNVRLKLDPALHERALTLVLAPD